jgi:hypothetical protein
MLEINGKNILIITFFNNLRLLLLTLNMGCCMEPTITIENVVTSTKLAEDFDLQKLMEIGLEGAEYNKTKFPDPVHRIKEPNAAFLIFTSVWKRALLLKHS